MKNVYLLLFVLAITGLISCQKITDEKPNFIIIFTDDQGYADLGSFGAKGFTTPNLDNLAREGIRFTSFYSASPVCSPSRAALLTGCYPVRVGVPAVLHPVSPTGLAPDEITIAEILKKKGYATACIGKWHLGDHSSMMPWNQGFDVYFGLPYSNDMWPWRNDYKRRGKGSDLMPDLPLYDGDDILEHNPDQNQLTGRYTKRAIRFIEENKNRPFFLYLPHTMPHVPLGVSDKFDGKSSYGRYGDVIEEIDWSVGEILKTLKKNNLEQNTLIIFTSDNGPWLTYGNHAGSAIPLREGKGTTFEGGMRVPCVMRWPGKIPAGTVSDDLATTMDLLPTIAHLVGSEAPSDRVIDGMDIWPVMSGAPDVNTSDRVLFYHFPSELQAIRQGKWKLHFAHQYRHQEGLPGKDGQSAGQTTEAIGLALFNLDNDIGETKNVAEDHPEVVDHLKNLADAHLDDLTNNSRATVRIEDINWRRYTDKLSEGQFLKDWWLIGPFDNKDRKGFNTIYPPESEFNPDRTYTGRNNLKIAWQNYKENKFEYISLAKIMKPSHEGVAYARRTIEVVKDTNLKLGVGTNDGVRMWVNGKLVLDRLVSRGAVPNEDVVTVPFKKGKNSVLLKIDQIGGGWGFYFSIMEGQDFLK
jgi:arylsulfatase A